MKPAIAITVGDPAGVGPEVVMKALADPSAQDLASWIVVGDRAAFTRIGHAPPPVDLVEPGVIASPATFEMGRMQALCGRAALAAVRQATELCLKGHAAAMVTAPLNKEAVVAAGEEFTGHTEYIANLCGASETRMLLVSERLRVIHVTTHVSLRRACDAAESRILRTIELGHDAMRLLGLEHPRIAVCGLNPHAGEHGLFGDEDDRITAPAVAAARERGILCDGPVPADTAFLRALRGAWNLVVAMYHDQGHIPMKLLDFERTVNVSVGLPIIRTSVDHGTAFDIAGRGAADPGSMIEAMKLAAAMAARQLR